MKKRMKKMIGLFCMSVLLGSVFGIISNAEELKDENPYRLETAYGIDENGDFFIIDSEPALVGDSAISTYALSRAATVNVVNMNTKGTTKTTEYTEYKTGAIGYTCGGYGADAAYIGEEDGYVIFMLSGVVGKVKASEVEVVAYDTVKNVSYYYVEDNLLKHSIAHKVTETSRSSLTNGTAPSYLDEDVKYYSYDGHYFYKDYATMITDYQNEIRDNSVNPKNPYYNYYQFLPLRSTTVYTATELSDLINGKVKDTSKMYGQGSNFVKHQNTYGVNALLMTAVAGNESAWGTSSICNEKNNLFGLDAIDSSPSESAKQYDSPATCIKDFAETYMSKRYLRPGYSYYNGGFLGNKASGINVRYASDPYWGEKAANHAYDLDRTGGYEDRGLYTIGIKDTISTEHTSVNVRSGSSTSATVLYKTGTVSNYAVLIRKATAVNDFYEIQSDGVLNADRTEVDSSTGKYDFNKMNAFISASYVDVVNKGKDTDFEGITGGDAGNDPADKEEKTYVKYKTTEKVNYRNGPGTSYDKIGSLEAGKVIEVEQGYSKEANGYTWYRFKMDSKNYYVASEYLEIYLANPKLVSAEYADGKVTVKWKKVASAKGYYVYRKVSGDSWSRIGTVKSGSTVTYTDDTVAAGKEYIYTVRAYNGDVKSGYDKTGLTVAVESKISLSNPVLVSAIYEDGKVTVKWKKVSNAEGYYVYRKISGDSWSRIGTVKSVSTVTYIDDTVAAGNEYIYTVRAYNGDVKSGYNKTGLTVEIPKAKTYVKYVTTEKVNYRNGPGTSYDKKGSLAADTIVQVEKGYSKKADGYKWYRIKLDSGNYYVASEYLKVYLAKPKLVSAEYKDGKVTFKWKKVASAKGYYVYRKISGESWSRIGTVESGSTVTYTDSTVKAGKEYIYTVRAYNGSVKSSYDKAGLTVAIPKAKTYVKFVTTTGVNYRTGPGTSYEKVGTLSKGTVIDVEKGYSKKADGYKWYRFKKGSKNYYIVSDYLERQ